MTPFLWACDHGRANCLAPLVAAGAKAYATDTMGKTGREIAADNDPPHDEVLAFLELLPPPNSREQAKAAKVYSEMRASDM